MTRLRFASCLNEMCSDAFPDGPTALLMIESPDLGPCHELATNARLAVNMLYIIAPYAPLTPCLCRYRFLLFCSYCFIPLLLYGSLASLKVDMILAP